MSLAAGLLMAALLALAGCGSGASGPGIGSTDHQKSNGLDATVSVSAGTVTIAVVTDQAATQVTAQITINGQTQSVSLTGSGTNWSASVPVSASSTDVISVVVSATADQGGSLGPTNLKVQSAGGTPTTLSGTLHVTSTPSGARLFINGTDTTQQTPADITQTVPANGTVVQVTVRLVGYEDATTTATILPNQTVTVDLTLRALQPPAEPPNTITGRVTATAPGGSAAPAPDAAVSATDTTSGAVYTATMDTSVDRAGVYYIWTPPGTFQVTASKSGFASQSKSVTVLTGDDRRTGIDFDLTP